jgi:hypothetical protein
MMSDNLPGEPASTGSYGGNGGSRACWCRARIKGVVVSNSKVRPAPGGIRLMRPEGP